MTKLLPCPFCGNAPKLTDYYGNYNKASWCVHCRECDLTLEGDATPDEAVTRWNTRAATCTEICMNEKCPHGGTPVEVIRSVRTTAPNH